MKQYYFLLVIMVTEIIGAPNDKTNHSLPNNEKKNNLTNININESLIYKGLESDNGKKLELLHIVFRHGERTPADTYPNDPYIDYSFEPYGWGQLTNIGKAKLYETAKWLRERYNQFLGPDYFPELVYAQSTGTSRTRMSLQLVLAGIFPPKTTPLEWNKELNWQPIPTYSQLLEEDSLLLVRNCPRYYEALEEVMLLPEIHNKLLKSKELLHNLTVITGLNITTAEDVSSLWSTLRAEEAYGLKLPEWTKNYYPKKMQELTDLSYFWNMYTPELKRIKGGPFITKMSNEWKKKPDYNLSKTKLFIYAGHDSTITNILGALDVWKQQYPEFSIMAIFELYKDTTTNKYEVKIYQKNEGEEPIPLILPGCKEICPLDKVLKYIEPLVTTPTLSKECTPHDASFTTPIPSGP